MYIDDAPASIAANNRTWYDGTAVRELVPVAGVDTLRVGGDLPVLANPDLAWDVSRLSTTGELIVGRAPRRGIEPR